MVSLIVRLAALGREHQRQGGLSMKGVVAFDSVYGNTQKVAEVIADEIRNQGHEVTLLNLGSVVSASAEGDFLVVGSPTRMKRMTSRTKRFVKKASRKEFKGRPMAAFDTVLAPPADPEKREKAQKWTENGAGPKIAELAGNRGMKVFPEVLRAKVRDIKGPLTDDALDLSREFARRFAASLKT